MADEPFRLQAPEWSEMYDPEPAEPDDETGVEEFYARERLQASSSGDTMGFTIEDAPSVVPIVEPGTTHIIGWGLPAPTGKPPSLDLNFQIVILDGTVGAFICQGCGSIVSLAFRASHTHPTATETT